MSQNNPKKFSAEDLKQFDGSNGKPLYVVFKGKVYDLTTSPLWLQGTHMGMHNKNDDLTEAIKTAPHTEDNVFRFPYVGEIAEPVLKAPPPLPLEEQKPVQLQVQSPPNAAGVMERRTFLKLDSCDWGSNHYSRVAFNFEGRNICAPSNHNDSVANSHCYKPKQTDKPRAGCVLLPINQHSELPCKTGRRSHRRHRTRK